MAYFGIQHMGAPSVYMMKQWKKGGILSTNRGQGGTYRIFGQKSGKRQTFEDMVNGEASLTPTKYICQKDAGV